MKRGTLYLLLIAGFGGTLFDFAGTIIGPALPYLDALRLFTTEELSRLSSAVVMSAGVACFVTGFIADRIGRKRTMLLSGVLALVSCLPICFSGGLFWAFYIGRWFQGFAAGIVGVVVPMYLVETLEPDSRGKGAAVFQLLDIGGILFCSLIGIAVVHGIGAADQPTVSVASKVFAWKAIMGSSALPAVLFLLGVCGLPESPVWLSRDSQSSQPSQLSQPLQSLLQRKYVVPFVLAVATLICNQTAGVTSLQLYAVTMFEKAGLSNSAANTANVAAMVVFTVATAVALPLVDRIGRRPLLIAGTLGLVVFHAVAGSAYLAIRCGFAEAGVWTGTVAAAGVSLAIGSFGFGPGVVAWLMLSELMPNRIRATGMSIAMFVNMLVAYLIADNMLLIGERFGYAVMLFFFAACCMIYFLLAIFALPETRGKTLEEIERQFAGKEKA